MDYLEALDHLDQLINYETQPRAGAVAGLSLSKMQQVVAVLGDPQDAYQVIHITGTNGKGSTARMIEAVLTAMGLRVGLYTSPHLVSPCERIRVGAIDLDQDTFGQAIGDIAGLIAATKLEALTWFETVTAAALAHFANEGVEVAVVEVGMLGRFDATNIVDAQVAVITNVGRDHTDGTTGWWQRVAKEKAGIVKAGASVVLGESSPELLEIVAAESPAVICAPTALDSTSGTASYVLQRHALVSNEVAVGGRLLSVETPRTAHADLFVGLHGAHQGHNARSAIVAAEEFFDAPTPTDVLHEALATVVAPGRLEVIQRSPLILLDAAHNPPGATALATALQEDFAPLARRFLVFGIQDGRDPAEVLEALDVAWFDLVIACTAPTTRGVAASALRDIAVSLGGRAEAIADVAAAMDYVLNLADDGDLLVIAGSVTVLELAREFAAEL